MVSIKFLVEYKQRFSVKAKQELCSCASTIVWMHHLDFNETPKEKAKWELLKDPSCCFEQIHEANPTKQLNGYLLPISQTIKERWTKATVNGTGYGVRTRSMSNLAGTCEEKRAKGRGVQTQSADPLLLVSYPLIK